jgi:hypothetical protein
VDEVRPLRDDPDDQRRIVTGGSKSPENRVQQFSSAELGVPPAV